MEQKPGQPLTAEQLAWYLFGNPFDPSDAGVIGRILLHQEKINKQISALLRLGWAVLIVFVAALITVVLDMLTRTGGKVIP